MACRVARVKGWAGGVRPCGQWLAPRHSRRVVSGAGARRGPVLIGLPKAGSGRWRRVFGRSTPGREWVEPSAQRGVNPGAVAEPVAGSVVGYGPCATGRCRSAHRHRIDRADPHRGLPRPGSTVARRAAASAAPCPQTDSAQAHCRRRHRNRHWCRRAGAGLRTWSVTGRAAALPPRCRVSPDGGWPLQGRRVVWAGYCAPRSRRCPIPSRRLHRSVPGRRSGFHRPGRTSSCSR